MTVADLSQAREYSQYDVSTRRFWAKSFVERDETFARMRAAAGLTWHPPLPSLFESNEPGFWAVTRRADIAHVSTHPELFSSGQGVALDPMPVEIQRIATFFLAMDPPQHTVYRRLISSAFTPKNVKRIEDQIHANAVAVVDDLVGAGDVDFVAACSTRLPMMTISDMLGVAPSEREAVAHAAEKLLQRQRRRVRDARGTRHAHHQRDDLPQQLRDRAGQAPARPPGRRPDDGDGERGDRRSSADR